MNQMIKTFSPIYGKKNILDIDQNLATQLLQGVQAAPAAPAAKLQWLKSTFFRIIIANT